MTTEARRTLVVDFDLIDRIRHELMSAADLLPAAAPIYNAKLNAINSVVAQGTTVPLDYLTVVELATPVRETPWQRQERDQERYYSEADYADADLSPAGGAA